MAVTEADFIRRVLEELNVLGEGQPVENDDAAKVRARMPTTFAALAANKVVYVTAITDVDDALVNPLVAIVARHCAKSFAITGAELAELITLADEAETTLRSMDNALDGEVNEPGSYF